MNELSLFSGAGGGLLGTKLLGFNHIGYVEYNDYCQRVIARRIKDGLLNNAPIYGDIKTFLDSGRPELYRGVTDIITAGFPCQPFSVAGKREASNDERNMWPATMDVIKRVKPAFCFLENVPGLLSATVDNGSDGLIHYYGEVLRDLAEGGFDAIWGVLGADDVGAPHHRKRLWILAYSKFERERRQANTRITSKLNESGSRMEERRNQVSTDSNKSRCAPRGYETGRETRTNPSGCGKGPTMADSPGERCGETRTDSQRPTERIAGSSDSLADTKNDNAGGLSIREKSKKSGLSLSSEDGTDSRGTGRKEQHAPSLSEREGFDPGSFAQDGRNGWWSTEPELGRVANGVANRVDRLKAIGNGQVPAVVAAAYNLLAGQE